jgi:hypothetical protein
VVVVTLLTWAAQGASSTDPRAASTKKMAALLAKLADEMDPMANGWLSDRRAAILRERVERNAGAENEPATRLRLARDLVNAGQLDECLAQLDRVDALLAQGGKTRLGRVEIEQESKHLRAIAWMRRGELDNCLARHCCESCILPLRSGAVHGDPRGSSTAIPILVDLLEKHPDDYEALWLLNLAHMTLGTWPDGVPARWRVPAKAFESEADFPRFPDVAHECGVDWSSLSGGAASEDYDGDGLLDLALTGSGRYQQMHVFRNRGDGTFEDRTHAAAVEGICGGLNLIQGDYDNDGDVDLYVLRGAWYGEQGCTPDSLLRNRGDGTFDDVTEEAGLLSFKPSQTGVFSDLDGDGWLDLVVGNETKADGPVHSCEVWVNQRDGTFRDFARETGATIDRFVKGVVAGDYDDDGRVDLYFSCRSAMNVLLHNESSEQPPGFRFRDVTLEAGVGLPNMSFPALFFDYDDDGRLDLYVATNAGFLGDRVDDIGRFHLGLEIVSERPCLYHNLGNGRFRNVAAELGADRAIFTMGANFGDLDHDGWLDLYLGTGSPDLAALLPNRLFRNDGGRRFQDVTTASGTGHLQKGHGVVFADFDNDGDEDLFEHLGGGVSGDAYPAALFENPGNSNHHLTLRLRGTKANRMGLGARILVRVATGADERSIHRVCGTGGSFGTSPLRQEIGLGDADRIVFVEIVWPGSGTRQRLESLGLDRAYEITEGEPTPRPLTFPRFQLGGEPRAAVDAAATRPEADASGGR